MGTGSSAGRRHPPELITVVMPVLDEAGHVTDQLAALAGQTYGGPWELIVSDNGSVDGTAEVVASWRDRLPPLRVVDASDQRGLNHARNVGVAHARGDFIAFCDGDDAAAAGWLEALVEAAPKTDIVAGAIGPWNGTGDNGGGGEAPGRLDSKHEFLTSLPGGNCGMWSTVAKDLGWDERFTFAGSDIEFSWRAQLAGYRIDYEPSAVMSVRPPETLRLLACKWFQYGASGGRLYRAFRDHGMPRSRVAVAAREWAYLLLHVRALAAPGTRQRWVQRASYRLGRLVGSVRARVLFV